MKFSAFCMNSLRFSASSRLAGVSTRQPAHLARGFFAAQGSGASSSTGAAFFDDQFFKIYDHFFQQHHHPHGPWKLMAKKVSTHVQTAAKPRILDLASASGEPAASFAKQFGHAEVFSTDISMPMVEKAQQVAQDIPNLEALHADMQDLSQFDDESMDVVSCCYGYMFPPDKQKAVQETFRVLKPGGIMVATTWDKVKHMEMLKAIMRRIEGLNPEDEYKLPVDPLSLSDYKLFHDYLAMSGFEVHDFETSTYPFDLSHDEDFAFSALAMIARQRLDELQAWEKARQIFSEILDDYLERDSEQKLVARENTFRCTVARKPLVG